MSKAKDQRLRTKYGITFDRFYSMGEAQDWRCAICKEGLEPYGKDYAAAVDHCHQTGRIRGLLCRRCNLGLGCFLDEPRFLRAAADYVEPYVYDLSYVDLNS